LQSLEKAPATLQVVEEKAPREDWIFDVFVNTGHRKNAAFGERPPQRQVEIVALERLQGRVAFLRPAAEDARFDVDSFQLGSRRGVDKVGPAS